MTLGHAAAFASLLQHHRLRAGLTQEELAERAGLSVRAISDLERGVKTRPRAYTVHHLAGALGLSSNDRTAFEQAARAGATSGEGRPEAGRPPVGAFLGATPEQPLVARDAERRALAVLLDAAAMDRGRLVLLPGEPGAGKTRLAQEAGALARERGFLCAVGRCYAPDASAPFTPFLDVFGALYAACPPAQRAEAPRRWPYLAWLLPDAGIAPPAAAGDGPDERPRLFRAAAGFLHALAERYPVAVLLDDLHWADSSSLALLAHLARQAPAQRVLLLGTYRDAEVGRRHPLTVTVHDLEREGLVEHIAVRTLGPDGTSALLAAVLGTSPLPAGLADYVYRRSDGNPFFVRHLLRSLQERGALTSQGERWVFAAPGEPVLPAGVRAVVEQRLARLDDAPVEILREASVLGESFSFTVLHAMGEREESAVEAALEMGEAAGLVRPRDADAYAFDHALTQQTLLAALSPRRLRRLHRAAGDAIERVGGGPEHVAALAWHWRQGEAPERALPYALLAGDQAAAVFAHEEATAKYRMAADLARRCGAVAPEAVALERLGAALTALGRPADAVTACDEAIARYRTLDDLEGEGRATAVLAAAHVVRGAAPEGYTRVRAVLERFEGREPSPAVAALYLALAPSRDTGLPEGHLAAAERATEVARAVGDERLLATAGVRRGLLLMVLGRPEAARRVLEEILPQVERSADYSTRLLALGVYSELLKLAGALTACRAQRERMAQLAEQVGDPVWRASAWAQLGEVCTLTGRWGEARAHLERATELSRPLPDPHVGAFALTGLGELCLAEGKGREASAHLESCLAAVQAAHYGHWVRIVQRLLAQRDLLHGRPAEAVVRVRTVADEEQEEHAGTMTVLARALLSSGDVAAADAASRTALAVARPYNNRLDLCEALLVRGQVAARLDDITAAEEFFQRALALAVDMPYPYAEGRILYAGGLARRQADPAGAREWLTTALAIFRQLKARWYTARTEQALGMLDEGGRVRA